MKSPLKSPGHGGRLHLGADAAVHHRWQRGAAATRGGEGRDLVSEPKTWGVKNGVHQEKTEVQHQPVIKNWSHPSNTNVFPIPGFFFQEPLVPPPCFRTPEPWQWASSPKQWAHSRASQAGFCLETNVYVYIYTHLCVCLFIYLCIDILLYIDMYYLYVYIFHRIHGEIQDFVHHS